MESVEDSPVSGADVPLYTGTCRGEEYRWRCFVGGAKPPKPENGDIWLESNEKPAVYWDRTDWVVEVAGGRHHFPRKDGSRNANVWLWKGRWYERTSVSRKISQWLKDRGISTATSQSQPDEAGNSGNVPDNSNIVTEGRTDLRLESCATPSAPTASCEGNQWLQNLYTLWVNGEARHIPIQFERGKQILSLLLSYPTPIPVLSRERGLGRGCTVYGDAVRNGRAPRISQVVTDICASLMNGREDLIIVNALTNEVEQSSAPNIIAQIYQQSTALGKDDWSSFNFSSTFLSVIDAPSSQEDGGSFTCHWTLNPFDDNMENISGRIGNTWTFPGAITFTHMDSIACGMNMIHWKGSKLWIVWPCSDDNLNTLKSLGCLRSVTDFNTVLILMRKLEDMELLWISEDDVKEKELGFYLDLNAIHACITFTESLHAGHAVRGTALTKNIEGIIRWYTRFVIEEMMTRHGVYSVDDKGLVEDLLSTLDIWEDVASQLRKRKKRTKTKDQERVKLDQTLKEARKQLSSARCVLSSSER